MKIRKYLVRNIEDAASQIEKDLGKDAYILSRKKVVKGGEFNRAAVEMIEVTAAVDTARPDTENISPALLSKKHSYSGPEGVEKEKVRVFGKLRPGPSAASRSTSSTSSSPAASPLSVIDDEPPPLPHGAEGEVDESEELLRAAARFDVFTDFEGIFLDLYLDMVEGGVERKIARHLIHTLQARTDAENIGDTRTIKEQLFSLLASYIAQPSPLRLKKGERRVVVLVGPTGSGKTTTIAKLSSYFKLMEAKKVGLVTIDSYRIGAEAHLRTYADILDVPFYAVYNERELLFRLEHLAGLDVVFIDTTGRSPTDKQGLLIMEKHLSTIPPGEKEVYLVLSASTKAADLYLIYEKYSVFKPDKFIFSKIDETRSLGNLFNLKVRADIPAAYFTTGQRVPEDIEIAYPLKFARRVFLNDNNDGKGESR
jgi:flagellar biosynthesis protein FlhF